MDDAARVRRVAARLERGLDLARSMGERVALIEQYLLRERRITLEEVRVAIDHLSGEARVYVDSLLRALE